MESSLIKKFLIQTLVNRRVAFVIDLHGHSRKLVFSMATIRINLQYSQGSFPTYVLRYLPTISNFKTASLQLKVQRGTQLACSSIFCLNQLIYLHLRLPFMGMWIKMESNSIIQLKAIANSVLYYVALSMPTREASVNQKCT